MHGRLLIPLALALVGGFGRPAHSVEPATDGQGRDRPAFSASSDLVVLNVMVTDKRGVPVPGLSTQAFDVREDGKPQTVEFFAQEDAPVTVGLVVDSSGSMVRARERVIAAVTAFAETSHPDDELFAITFNDDVRTALPRGLLFTHDAMTLRSALETSLVARGRTALYDAVAAGLDQVTLGTHLRHVLVVVSDGGDNASAAVFEEILQRAETSNTVIYTVAIADPLEQDANPKRLRQIARASGGEGFEPRDVAAVSAILRDVARDIRNSYTVGYVSTNNARDGRLRQVRIVVTGPNGGRLKVRTRQGYVVEER